MSRQSMNLRSRYRQASDSSIASRSHEALIKTGKRSIGRVTLSLLRLLEFDELGVSTWTYGPAPTPSSSELLVNAFTVKKQRFVIESTLPARWDYQSLSLRLANQVGSEPGPQMQPRPSRAVRRISLRW